MTDTLAPAARSNLVFSRENGALNGVTKYRQGEGGNLILEGVAVFRSGTFRDSMGFQHQWEAEHMSQMVDNHAALAGREILTNVPVRADHVGFLDSSLKSVIGYCTNLRTEERMNSTSGEMCNYLLVDFEIIDEDAIKKIESGLWRNLSSEIGTYITNAEAEYWPVFMGVAFVDFPAVEGLANSFSKRAPNGSGIHAGSAVFSLVNEQEEPDMASQKKESNKDEGLKGVKLTEGTLTAEKVTEGTLAAHSADTSNEGEQNDREDEDEANEGEQEVQDSEEGGESQESEGSDEGEGEGEQGNAEFGKSGQAFQFSVNGQPTADFAAVQAHITSLEATVQAGKEKAVGDFVKGLSDEGKILATQVDSLTEFAKSLSDSQYEAWASQYGSMPTIPLFAAHGAGSNRIENPEDLKESEAIKNEIKIQKEILADYQKAQHGKSLPSVQKKIESLEAQLKTIDEKN